MRLEVEGSSILAGGYQIWVGLGFLGFGDFLGYFWSFLFWIFIFPFFIWARKLNLFEK